MVAKNQSWYTQGEGYPLRNDFNYTGENEWYNNNNQGIASASMNVPQDMRQYFAGTNAPVYPGSAYSPHRGFNEFTAQAPEKKQSIFVHQ